MSYAGYIKGMDQQEDSILVTHLITEVDSCLINIPNQL